MFKQIFRITFVTLVWKQYKQIIVSTLMLFAYLWLVGSIHADYLSYAELQADESLAGHSFLMKWAALATGVVLYIAYHFIRGSRRKSEKIIASSKSKENKVKSKPNSDNELDSPDPFAQIRAKDKLRTRLEIMNDKQSNN